MPAIIDSRANGVLINLLMLKRKGLLDQIDLLHKVMINQANAEQKFLPSMPTWGVG